MSGNDLSAAGGTPSYTAVTAKFGSGSYSGSGTVFANAPAAADSFLGTLTNGAAIGTGTFEGWVQTTATALKVAMGHGGLWWIGIDASGHAQFVVGNGANVVSTTVINDGAWHHVALVINAGIGSLYVDGNRVALDTTARTASTPAANMQVAALGGGFVWPGAIDEVRVSSTARYSGTTYTVPSAAFPNSDSVATAIWHFESNLLDSSTTTDSTAPTVPGTPTATAGNASASVAFAASTDNVAVAGYRVYSSADSYTAVAATGSGSPITVTGLTNGTAYTFEVSAYDAAGNESAKSAASNSVTPATSSGTIAPNDANIVFSPYNWDVTASRAFSNCGGAYFRTLIGGSPSAITLNFDVSSMTGTFPSVLYYRVDGGPWTQATVAATVAVTIPGTTSNWSKRLLEVVVKTTTESVNRWASPYATAVKFTGITTTPNTCTTQPIQACALKGVVFGDSITEGINVLGNTGDTTQRSDALLSYAYALRDALGAEVGVVGYGGTGVTVSGSGNVPAVATTWNLHAASISRSFAAAPDFIVLNEGTNDSRGSVASATFQTALTSLLNAIIAGVTATPIFVLLPFGGYYGATVYQAAIAACTTPSRVTFVDTTSWWSTADSIDSLHPYGYSHLTQLSPRVAASVKAVIGGAVSKRFVNVGGVAKAVGTVVKV